jgi:hypothetical protein
LKTGRPTATSTISFILPKLSPFGQVCQILILAHFDPAQSGRSDLKILVAPSFYGGERYSFGILLIRLITSVTLNPTITDISAWHLEKRRTSTKS